MSDKAFLSVPNWDELQHYTDRSPPWIKLHNKLLENYDFECLPDASKAHILCIWLLASRTNNKINADPRWIARKICANTDVDIELLVASGFLVKNQQLQNEEQSASDVLATCLSRGRVEGEQSRGRVEGKEQQGYDDYFLSFWKDYPNKSSKKTAYTTWKKLSADEKQKAIDALPAAKQSRKWQKDNGDFIPHPATWLNAAGWDDEHGTEQDAEIAALSFGGGNVIEGQVIFEGVPHG